MTTKNRNIYSLKRGSISGYMGWLISELQKAE